MFNKFLSEVYPGLIIARPCRRYEQLLSGHEQWQNVLLFLLIHVAEFG
mgnify:CR=1 FL=1